MLKLIGARYLDCLLKAWDHGVTKRVNVSSPHLVGVDCHAHLSVDVVGVDTDVGSVNVAVVIKSERERARATAVKLRSTTTLN